MIREYAACAVMMSIAFFTGIPAISSPAPTATPSPSAVQTAPPDVAVPSPTPQPLIFNGQVIDLERGYVVFSTGDALKVSPSLSIVDDQTSQSPTYTLMPGYFAVAILDPASGAVTQLRTARHPLSSGNPISAIPRHYVVAVSSPKPNPDLIPRQPLFTSALSKAVTVTITVQVPPNTPFTDDVYMATDSSGWNPLAIKMQRLDGLHFRIQMDLRGGTVIHYLFTRGAWSNVERDKAGLQRSPRTLLVPGGDTQVVDATIYRWADIP